MGRSLLILAAVSVPLFLMGYVAIKNPWGSERFAHYLESQTQEAPDEEVYNYISQLDQLGTDGFASLVNLLDDPRTVIADAAETALENRINRWKVLLKNNQRKEELSQELLALSEALANRANTFTPRTRRIVSRWGFALYQLAEEHDLRPKEPLLVAHEVLLQLTAHQSATLFASETSDSLQDHDTLVGSPDENGGLLSLPLPSSQEEMLAERSVSIKRFTQKTTETAAIKASITHSKQSLRKIGWKPFRLRGRAYDALLPFRRGWQPTRVPRQTFASDSFSDKRKPLVQLEPNHYATIPKTPPIRDTRWELLSTRQVIEKLHVDDPALVKVAEQELLARGLNATELNVAKRFSSPLAEDREQLALTIPGIQNIEAKTWLLWLAEDKNADVRLAAMSVLATVADPATRQKIQRKAQNDTDPRIAELARMIARQQ